MDLLTIIITLLSMLALCNAGEGNITCSDNEVPVCESACAPTCQNRNPTQPCTEQCLGPCSCQKGYIREGPGGRCVPNSCEGVPICNKHEKFTICPNYCPRICDQIPRRHCPETCLRAGCVCEDGYVRETAGGKCIPNSKCNQKCDENEHYDNCGSGCPGTCNEPNQGCEKRCFPGCFCKEGYILDDITLKCIRKEDCRIKV